MMRVFLVLVWIAVAASYPTDNPISEPPNILTAPDNMDNSIEDIANLGILASSIQDDDDDDCGPDQGISSTKRSEVPVPSPPVRRQCSNRNFLRLGRGSDEPVSELDSSGDDDSSLLRLGRGGKSNDNFIRFGRGGKNKDNFIRFGRGSKLGNFIRFGRGRPDNFIRFGRGKTDNFIRFGRGKSENFIRFGRTKPQNFIRFGRGKQDNFIRFGRGAKDNNFLRFGRDGISNLETVDAQPDEDESSISSYRVSRGGKGDGNFIRFGRAKASNFIRLGRGNEELERDERSKANSNFLRLGRQAFDDSFERFTRTSGTNNDLRRGKLADRNFIRLGRSGQQYESDNRARDEENSARPGRSENQANSRNFIRLGKRSETNSNLVRFGRDVEEIDETPMLSTGEAVQINNASKTNDEYPQTRTKRSITYSEDDDNSDDSSDYPTVIGNSAYDDVKIPTSNLEDAQIPFRYYSPLSSGIPNYILGPELSVVAPLTNGAESKRGKSDNQNRNYIRLG